jgi:hypothetical protein
MHPHPHFHSSFFQGLDVSQALIKHGIHRVLAEASALAYFRFRLDGERVCIIK